MTAQKKPLPPATIPFGFEGKWTPDPAVYGNLISPDIVVTKENWPVGAPETDAVPQFATDIGQQIGSLFFYYNTYGGPPGWKPGSMSCGYLANPVTQAWPPSAKRGVVGKGNYVNQLCLCEDNWQGVMGQPFINMVPPA